MAEHVHIYVPAVGNDNRIRQRCACGRTYGKPITPREVATKIRARKAAR